MKRLGQSGRKGILFHGHPGTGKTHVIRYVASNLPGHTIILVNYYQMLNMEEYSALARIPQPCVMVFEDADLVARAREDISGQKAETRLNRMLNEMDGLGTDADTHPHLPDHDRLERPSRGTRLALRPCRSGARDSSPR
ncbi:ATP-binding protein (plasmid) [Rhizobium ruizarguesonis]|nr:ATP-binding protein [Rhizobium ruizarguesonis]